MQIILAFWIKLLKAIKDVDQGDDYAQNIELTEINLSIFSRRFLGHQPPSDWWCLWRMENEKFEKKWGMSRNLISLPRFDQSEVTARKKLFNLFYFRSLISDQFPDCWSIQNRTKGRQGRTHNLTLGLQYINHFGFCPNQQGSLWSQLLVKTFQNKISLGILHKCN